MHKAKVLPSSTVWLFQQCLIVSCINQLLSAAIAISARADLTLCIEIVVQVKCNAIGAMFKVDKIMFSIIIMMAAILLTSYAIDVDMVEHERTKDIQRVMNKEYKHSNVS